MSEKSYMRFINGRRGKSDFIGRARLTAVSFPDLIHIYFRGNSRVAERMKLESILTLVTENANRKSTTATARIECCPYKLDYSPIRMYCSFPDGRLAVNLTRGKLAKFYVAKDRVHFLPTSSAYRISKLLPS